VSPPPRTPKRSEKTGDRSVSDELSWGEKERSWQFQDLPCTTKTGCESQLLCLSTFEDIPNLTEMRFHSPSKV
jgi:hypothetical protein